MTTLLILGLSMVAGASVPRWRMLLLPLLTGGLIAAVVAMNGHGLADTPIPFLVVTATMAMAGGVLLGTRRQRHSR